jgi:hypothetical protein
MLGGLWTTYLADQPLDFFGQRESERYGQTRSRQFSTYSSYKRKSYSNVAEPPNAEYPSSITHLGENIKLHDSVEHTARENSKIHIFTLGSQMRE